MTMAWITAASPLAGLIVDVTVQVATAHASGRIGTSIVAGAGAGCAATLGVLVGTGSGVGPDVVAMLTYFALAFCFWTFLNLNVTSLRIRILREVLNAGGRVSLEELAAKYSDHEFLSRRLARLEAGKQLTFDGQRWHLNSKLLLILARTMNAARSVIVPVHRDE